MYESPDKDIPSDRSRPAPVFKSVVEWIVETDRKFRIAQNRIDRFADRF